MKRLAITGLMVLGSFTMSHAQCKTVTGLQENFDSWKDIDKCWNAESGKAMLYHGDGRIIFYSMMSPKENMFLATPKIKAGKYILTLNISKNSGDASLEILSVGNPSDQNSFISLSKPSIIEGDKKAYNITLTKDAHLGLKVLLNGIHQAVYIDNFVLKPAK